MRVASFSAPGQGGQLVDVSVVPLGGLAGGDLSNVIRWRGQVGLGPVPEEDLAKLGEPVTVGGAPAQLFDLAGTPAGATVKARILAVALHGPDRTWFFKATGDDESVGLQKANFISWLKSIQLGAADATAALPAGHPDMGGTQPALPAGHPDVGSAMPPMGAMPGAGPAPALPALTVPAAWQTEPLTAMVLAKYSATENGRKADISISSLAGDGGGMLANVTRWRRQIGLPAIEEAGLSQVVTPLTTPAGPASVVDLTGTDPKTGQAARLLGVVLPVNGQSWFFKCMGDPTVVEHQKADFLTFVQSAKF
jgi:hypothetical protein